MVTHAQSHVREFGLAELASNTEIENGPSISSPPTRGMDVWTVAVVVIDKIMQKQISVHVEFFGVLFGVFGTHAVAYNLFNPARHLARAEHCRHLRVSVFADWSRVVA